MHEILLLNPEGAAETEVKGYTLREAARAVVKDADGNVALLHVKNDSYYKLADGGIDEGESKEEALKRECMEEIGCDVEIERELGWVTEYRKFLQSRQISYCYLVKVKGEKGAPQLMPDEVELGFEVVWVTYEEALRLLTQCNPKSLDGKEYIVPRDIAVMEAAWA